MKEEDEKIIKQLLETQGEDFVKGMVHNLSATVELIARIMNDKYKDDKGLDEVLRILSMSGAFICETMEKYRPNRKDLC